VKPLAFPFVAFFLLASQFGYAGSANWKANPPSDDWYAPANWTPGTVPNGPSDTATFNTSTKTAISLAGPSFTQLDGIIYNPGASAFTTILRGGADLSLEGMGIINNSGTTQTFVVETDLTDGVAEMNFSNGATSGGFTSISTFGGQTAGQPGAVIQFFDTSSAGNGNFIVGGGAVEGSFGSFTNFYDNSTAANGTFTSNGGAASNTSGASISFGSNSTAGSATITNNGASVVDANSGGQTYFSGSSTSTAGNATIIANAGSNGGHGGCIYFNGSASGGIARMEVFGNGAGDATNGTLDIQNQVSSGVGIGSLEGSGLILLGLKKLTVGSNNLSTTFSGIIQDSSGSGSLAKTGKGRFTLSNANTYAGGTTVGKGTLLVTNRTGSATGTGAVTVNAGTLGGTGKISGAVTIGTATTAAILAPGNGVRPGKLSLSKTLTFNGRANYEVDLNSTLVTADEVVAKGVTINSGATVAIGDLGTATLPAGTSFTLINNTSLMPISGTFSNLPDGSTITVGNNTFQANYEGGDGNDLTLTVVP